METIQLLVGASATVIASLIAASVTFLVAVFTKESKISEFRQTWIDELRNDLSEFVGIWYFLSHEFEDAAKRPEFISSREFWVGLKPEVLRVEQLQARIELRLNPAEHVELTKQLQALAKLESFIGQPFASRKDAINRFITESQRVLGVEWRVVKRGEPTYRWVKRLSLAAVIVALVALAWLAGLAEHIGSAP